MPIWYKASSVHAHSSLFSFASRRIWQQDGSEYVGRVCDTCGGLIHKLSQVEETVWQVVFLDSERLVKKAQTYCHPVQEISDHENKKETIVMSNECIMGGILRQQTTMVWLWRCWQRCQCDDGAMCWCHGDGMVMVLCDDDMGDGTMWWWHGRWYHGGGAMVIK